jgi:23S rRNA pseudouridine955/2504/2580 synthase
MNMTEFQFSARLVDVSPEYGGQRIDNFLLRLLKSVPRSLIYRFLRKGEVRVNGARIRPDYRLQAGDKVRIPPVRTLHHIPPVYPPRECLDQLEKAVLYEDQQILILNKPAGIAVHKGSGLRFGVIDMCRILRPQASFLELAHRLDRETSGCLVLAKSLPALRIIQSAWRAGTAKKHYLALVQGYWRRGTVAVSEPLRKVLRSGEHMVTVGETGKSAKTYFRPVTLFGQASLLEVTPATGRTHQIRVHAAYVKHPIAGDDKYGDSQFNQEMASYGLRRMFLHAHSVTVPLGSREVAISAPLDETLKDILDNLESRP